LLADARFHNLLLALDRDLAAAARAKGCVRCGGVLHSARFRRKPRGSPAGVDEGYDWERHRDAIGPTVAALRSRSDFDATRPLIEFYRSQSELRLLAPVV